MIRFIILSFMLYVCYITNVYSQTREISDIITNEDIIVLEKKIMTQFKKTKCYNKRQTYTMLHIFTLSFTKQRPYDKDDFLDENFIKYLTPCYTRKQIGPKRNKEWKDINLSSLYPSYINIYDSIPIATSNGVSVGCNPHCQSLIHYLIMEHIDNDLVYFVLNGSSLEILAVDKENHFYMIIEKDKENIILCPLKIYVEEHWGEGFFR